MTGDSSFFEDLHDIPHDFHVKQIQGEIPVEQWGTVRLSTDLGEGKWGELVLGDVLYMPGMKVKILSLQWRGTAVVSTNFLASHTPESNSHL